MAPEKADGRIIVAHLGSGASLCALKEGRSNEGLFILGWVANWRPMEIFLYDWLPFLRRKRLFARLARAKISVSAR